MRKVIAVTAAILFFVSNIFSFADQNFDERWSDEVVGEAIQEEMTNKEAERLCLNRAKALAIEQVAGANIESITQVKDFKVMVDLVKSQTHAWIKEYKIIKWESESIQRKPNEPPQIVYRVKLKALVAVDRKRDEGFSVKLNLNRNTFKDGDEMQITVQSGQDAYLTIFNVLEDDRVTVLLPNRFRMERFAKKGEKVFYPDPDIVGRKLKLKIFRATKASSVNEAILVVATKDDIDLIENDFSEAVFAQYPKQTGIFSKIWEKLMNIPPNRRAVAVYPYEIQGENRFLY